MPADKPGYLGKPVPGITAAILDDDDREIPYFEMGRLVLKYGWPAAARAIWGRDDCNSVYLAKAPWLKTGDFAFTDDEDTIFIRDASMMWL